MNFRKLIGAALCAATVAAIPAAAQAQNYKPEYKLSIVVGTTFPWGQGAEIWSNLVRERTQGRINIKVYPGTSLVQGDQTREFTAIRQGVIDMAVGSTINWSPQVKQLNLMVSCRIARVPMESTVRWVVWLLGAMFLVLVAVLVFPQLALWLPHKLGY